MKRTIILLLLFSACKHPSYTPKYIIDGDTFYSYDIGKIRLAYVDAPESSQLYGSEAKDALAKLIAGKQVTLRIIDTDQYGRKVALVYVGDTCINECLAKSGWVWVYKKYAPAYYYNDMQQARAQRIGIWAANNEPPFLYRQSHKK
jgi:endonuclease YncB( thermonuclease family)